MEPHIPRYVAFGNAIVKLFTRLGIRTVTAFGTENRAAGSFLVQAGATPNRSPEGIAAAAPRVAVFEVTPA